VVTLAFFCRSDDYNRSLLKGQEEIKNADIYLLKVTMSIASLAVRTKNEVIVVWCFAPPARPTSNRALLHAVILQPFVLEGFSGEINVLRMMRTYHH
jgi:hypothetical protein